MGYTEHHIEKVRGQIQAADLVLTEARVRRDSVLALAKNYAGSFRTFGSGSLAHFTVIKPVSDADCGLVLDRRVYPDLGPDGDGMGPCEIVADVRDLIGSKLRDHYPKARLELTKRAIKVSFNEPVTDQEDPTVDLIVCVTRKENVGLWIPHLERNDWDASHPEMHTELFTEGVEGLRRVRRRVVRLAKAHNKQFKRPALSSFNIEALALEAIKKETELAEALLALFSHGADSLSKGPTEDPAGVSGPIQTLNPKEAVKRLRVAADGITDALAHDDDDCAVRAALSRVFFNFVEPCDASGKEAFASSVRKGTVVLGSGLAQRQVRPVRSHGDSS